MKDVIEFTAEKKRRYTTEKKIDPAKLLPILRDWKEKDPEKYSTLVAMICGSAGTSPEELKRRSGEQRPIKKVVDLDKYFSYRQVDPESLLQIFREWRAAEPEKYFTMAAMICYSANIEPESLL